MEEGQKATLTCNATGVPAPKVTWYRQPGPEGGDGAGMRGGGGGGGGIGGIGGMHGGRMEGRERELMGRCNQLPVSYSHYPSKISGVRTHLEPEQTIAVMSLMESFLFFRDTQSGSFTI